MTPRLIERLTMMVNARGDVLFRQQDARVEESKAEILQLEREATNLMTFLREEHVWSNVRVGRSTVFRGMMSSSGSY